MACTNNGPSIFRDSVPLITRCWGCTTGICQMQRSPWACNVCCRRENIIQCNLSCRVQKITCWNSLLYCTYLLKKKPYKTAETVAPYKAVEGCVWSFPALSDSIPVRQCSVVLPQEASVVLLSACPLEILHVA